jgi:hypothetical protein
MSFSATRVAVTDYMYNYTGLPFLYVDVFVFYISFHAVYFLCFYCSHTAIEAPERCVFGQMVNVGAVMCKYKSCIIIYHGA